MKTFNLLFAPFFLLVVVIFPAPHAQAAKSALYCMVDESTELSEFYCIDENLRTKHKRQVEPIKANEFAEYLISKGVDIISAKEFRARLKLSKVVLEDLHDAYYRIDEFNKLSSDDPTVERLKKLAKGLQDAGVCDLKVKHETYNNIDIETSDDVLHQFLCISNSESVFGLRNIGQGGRGPWGIHPMHNKSDGICYPGQAVVRNKNGEEIKDSNLYKDPKIILENAKCAMVLYRKKGFVDWGKGKAWGSNRHCSHVTRDRLQFKKHLGLLGCCSESCKDKVRATQGENVDEGDADTEMTTSPRPKARPNTFPRTKAEEAPAEVKESDTAVEI